MAQRGGELFIEYFEKNNNNVISNKMKIDIFVMILLKVKKSIHIKLNMLK